MADSTLQVNDISRLVESWIKTTTNFWKDMGAIQEGPAEKSKTDSSSPTDDEDAENDNFRTYKTWETSMNNMASFMKLLSTPENIKTTAKSCSAFMDAAIQASGESLESFSEVQSRMLEGFAKINEHTKAYNLDDLDHDAFESFRQLYRSEIQKYLHVPKLGLPRQFHEQLTHLVDRSNIYYSHLFELLFLFHQPFEKTNRKMQEITSEMLKTGDFVDDPKQTYNEWITMLEGHFTDLLKSREYTSVLNNTIGSFAEYKSIKNDINAFFLKDLQVPTNKEMDEVYRDLYQTKKKLNNLTREVESLSNELKLLSAHEKPTKKVTKKVTA